MSQRATHLHPVVLVLLAFAIGIVFNLALWQMLYGAPPTVAIFYHSAVGCLRVDDPYREVLRIEGTAHRTAALRDWLMNNICGPLATLRLVPLKFKAGLPLDEAPYGTPVGP